MIYCQQLRMIIKIFILDKNFMFKNAFENIISDTRSYNPETHKMSDYLSYAVENSEVIQDIVVDYSDKLDLTINYLILIIVNAIKEISSKIDILKNEIIELKSKI